MRNMLDGSGFTVDRFLPPTDTSEQSGGEVPEATTQAVQRHRTVHRGYTRGRLPHDWDLDHEGETEVDRSKLSIEELTVDVAGIRTLRIQARDRLQTSTIREAERKGIPANALLRARGLPLIETDQTDSNTV